METLETLGKYEIKRTLGRGATGVVYEGWDPIIARRVAIKTVRLPNESDAETEDALARFRREAQAAGRLTHPNIVGVFDYGETTDLAFIVMEFVDGPTLKTLLDKHERFALPDIIRIMGDLLAGLQFSHERGVVHRDIKPANVMLTSTGQAKITDFGIARIESSSMTQAGQVLGTPAYMSPEQFMGQVVDARSDIYSSGVLLYQLLTGDRPFDGSMSSIMHKALNTDPPAPSQISVTAPHAFDSVVRRAMAKRPEDRYRSATAFVEALRAAASEPDEPVSEAETTMVSAPPPTPPPTPSAATVPATPVTPPAKRTAAPIVALLAVALLLIIGGGGAWWFLLRPQPEPVIGTNAPRPPETPAATPPKMPTTDTAVSTPPPPPATPPAPSNTSSLNPPSPVTTPAPAPIQSLPQASPPTAPSAILPQTRPPTQQTTSEPAPAPNPPSPVTTPAPAPIQSSQQTSPQAVPSANPLQTRPPTQQATSEPPPPSPVTAPTPAPTQSSPQTSPPAAPSANPPQTRPSTQQATSEPAPAPVITPGPPAAPPPAKQQLALVAVDAVRHQIADWANTRRCAILQGDVHDGGLVALSGFAGNTGMDALRQGLVAIVPPPEQVDWRVAGVDAAFCPTLDTLHPVAAGFGTTGPRLGLAMADGKARLHDGDPVRVRLVLPDFPSRLRVDYIVHDGSVQHLYPQLADPANRIVADPPRTFSRGEQVTLEDPAWLASAPYGTDMIIAVASSEPLFDKPRPSNAETTAVYLRDLKAAIDTAERRGTRMSGAAVTVEALPK